MYSEAEGGTYQLVLEAAFTVGTLSVITNPTLGPGILTNVSSEKISLCSHIKFGST